jgi:type I restriction enzyme S subunit
LSKWQEVELGQLCKIHHGYAFKSEDFADSGPIVVTPGNFTEDGFLDFENKRVVRLGGEWESKWELHNGSLLVVMTDLSQQKKILGATVVLNSTELVLHNQRIGWIEIFDAGIEPRFLRYAVMTRAFRRYVSDSASGTMVQHTSPTKLQNGKVWVAPKNEQTRIVTAIESLQQRSNRARTLLSDIRPMLTDLRQSILQAAFSGRLTADWRAKNPDVEPADKLLARIRTERRQRWETGQLEKFKANGKKPPKHWQDKYKEPEPVDDSELPELPVGWCWAFLPDLGEVNRGKSKHRPRNAEHLYGGPYPFVQTGDVSNSEGYITQHTQTYSEDGLAQSRLWPLGTVCITIAANIASSAVLTYEACFPDSVVGVLTDSNICEPEYIEFFIRTAKENLERYAPATAQKNINLGILSELIVPVPPVEESEEIVARLKKAMESILLIDETYLSADSTLNELDQSILSKAFRGELVPQDPNDEPASELLARILASREAQATKTKVGKKKTGKRQAKKKAVSKE